MDRIFYNESRFVTNIQGFNSPAEFLISDSGPHYTDLKQSCLFVKAHLVKSDGTLGEKNVPLQTMRLQIKINVNEMLVSTIKSHHPWEAYVKMMLNSGTNEQNSQMRNQQFYNDDENPLD